MASGRLREQVRFVVDSVRDRQYDNLRRLRSAVDLFTQPSDEHDDIKEGVWELVAAIPLFAIDLGFKFDLAGSDRDRYRFLLCLLTIWSQRQQMKAQAKTKFTVARRALGNPADNGKHAKSIAAPALYPRKERRKTRLITKTYKHSPLAENSMNVSDDVEIGSPRQELSELG
ncbi:MAG: hypothetical protein Q9159_005393 [Coniocarpon cinnabarinum]